jgi:hypothetical protein
MAGPLKIVFIRPGEDVKFYLYRDSEITPDILQARHFNNADSCVAFRDRFREQYPKCTIFIEDVQGNRLFEREAQPSSEPTDNRADVFIVPDAYETSGLGFILRAATTPTLGRCYALRACDVPSMVGRSAETIYAIDPIQAVERGLLLWAPFIQPLEHPLKEQRDTVEAKKLLQQIEKIKQGPGRRRPGND